MNTDEMNTRSGVFQVSILYFCLSSLAAASKNIFTSATSSNFSVISSSSRWMNLYTLILRRKLTQNSVLSQWKSISRENCALLVTPMRTYFVVSKPNSQQNQLEVQCVQIISLFWFTTRLTFHFYHIKNQCSTLMK